MGAYCFVHRSGKKIVTEAEENGSFCVVHTLDDALETQTMEDGIEDVDPAV